MSHFLFSYVGVVCIILGQDFQRSHFDSHVRKYFLATGPDSMDAHDSVCNILFFVSVLVCTAIHSVYIVLFFFVPFDINFQFLMIHVFMLLQVVFPTFDPPEIPASMGGVGHWVSIFLDLNK